MKDSVPLAALVQLSTLEYTWHGNLKATFFAFDMEMSTKKKSYMVLNLREISFLYT